MLLPQPSALVFPDIVLVAGLASAMDAWDRVGMAATAVQEATLTGSAGVADAPITSAPDVGTTIGRRDTIDKGCELDAVFTPADVSTERERERERQATSYRQMSDSLHKRVHHKRARNSVQNSVLSCFQGRRGIS